ncbi:MAG: helix-turn-helix domain-containing protein [Sphingomonadaceae bacterium]
MPATIEKPRDSRSDATRRALIEAAERLFADHGFAGVSVRQIGAAIGSGNNTVVAYHFGNKDGLIHAIYAHRLPDMDARRGELLEEIRRDDAEDDLSRVLRAIWLPLVEFVDADGMHTYARFLGSILREGLGRTRSAETPDFPNTRKLVALAARHMPHKPGVYWTSRWTLATALILRALHEIDTIHAKASGKAQCDLLFEDAMAMAQAALTAPAAQ